MKNRLLPGCLAAIIIFGSCHEEKAPTVPPAQLSETVIQLKPGYWTYYDISEESVSGYSLIGDSIQDAEWYGRSDWDIAFSENGMRTNGGTSGHGRGGIRMEPQIPDTLELTEYEEYRYLFTDFIMDTLDVRTLIPMDN